jgi:hypothetical protein
MTGTPHGTVLSVAYDNNEMTLAHLQKLSEAFGTRDINLTCDSGTSSDRGHYRMIVISEIRIPGRSY